MDSRVTYIDFFDKYIINKFIDHAVIEVGIIVWFFLSFRGKTRYYIVSIYGGIALIGLFARFNIITDIVTLISLPLAIFFLIYDKFAFKKILYVRSDLAVNYIAIITTVTGIASIGVSLLPLFFNLSSSLHVPNYAYDIFSLFSSLSPILMLLLIFCLPLKLLINAFNERVLKIKYNDDNVVSAANLTNIIGRRNKVLYLTLFIVLSTILVLIPHQPTINKDDQQIGVDTTYYVNWLGNLTKTDNAQEFLQQAFVLQSKGDRPLTLTFLFTLIKITNIDPFYVVEYIPAILGPVLILVIYFLARELTSNDITSLLAAFLTAVSFHTLVGIYAGFYANWLALAIGYLSATFLIKFLRESRKLNYALFSALIVILLLTHVYTWSILVIVFTIFLVFMLTTRYYPRKSIILLLIVIAFSVAIDVTRTTLTGSAGGIIRDLEIAEKNAGIEQFSHRWTTLTETIQIYVGGQFSNFIILALCLYWLFLFNINKASNILIIIFLSTGFLPLFLGDWVLHIRVLYNIPFQIPAAIALAYLKKQTNIGIMFVPVCIWLIAMSILAVSNFYLIPPSR